MKSATALCVHVQTKVLSETFVCEKEENVSTTSGIYKPALVPMKNTQKRKALSTLESQATIRRRTCKDKFVTSLSLSSPTLDPSEARMRSRRDQASTLRGKDFVPFWTHASLELSKKLWCCTKTDSHILEQTSWNAPLKKLAQGSWFTVNVLASSALPMLRTETSPKNSQSLSQSITAADQLQTERDAEKSRKTERVRQAKMKAAAAKLKKSGKLLVDMKSHKIRLYPKAETRRILDRWLGAARWTYNQCVAVKRQVDAPALEMWKEMKETENMMLEDICNKSSVRSSSRSSLKPSQKRTYTLPENKGLLSKKALRSKFVNEDALKARGDEWALEVPYDIRDEGMADLLKAIAAQNAKDKWVRSNFKFRRKKAPQESIVIRQRYFSATRGMYAPVLQKLNPVEKLPAVVEADCRIMRTRLREYYLVMPIPCKQALSRSCGEGESKANTPTADRGVVSLDPGVRTFMTGYDPSARMVFEWGSGSDNQKLRGLCERYDSLQSVWSKKSLVPEKLNSERRRKLRNAYKRAGLRVFRRVRNYVDEVHKRLSKYLCENYSCIITSDFSTKSMCDRRVGRGGRTIVSKTARSMYTWSHYRFRQRLLAKAREYSPCCVLVRGEEYTSKTCGSCGHLNVSLGSSKTFECPACCIVFDRDANGARNILLKTLTELAVRM